MEFAEPLSQGSGRLGAPTASPAAPPVTPRDCRRPLDTMKETEVHPKQVKVVAVGRGQLKGPSLWPVSSCTSLSPALTLCLVWYFWEERCCCWEGHKDRRPRWVPCYTGGATAMLGGPAPPIVPVTAQHTVGLPAQCRRESQDKTRSVSRV